MATTAFLSMWLSNTATAAMMLPIAQAVLKELGKCTDAQGSSSASQTVVEPVGGEVIPVRYRRILSLSGATGIADEADPSSVDQQNRPLADAVMEEEDELVTITERVTPVSLSEDGMRGGGAEQPMGREGVRGDASPALSQTVNRLGKGLMIGVAYAANIGGIATLTGTGPNLVLRGDVSKYVCVCGRCTNCSVRELVLYIANFRIYVA